MNDNILSSKKIQNAVILVLVILFVYLFAKSLTEFRKFPSVGKDIPLNTVTVNGKGEVFAPADIATFSFSVNESGSTVAEAQKKATEKSNKAIELIKGKEVEEKDIKTVSYNVYPKYDYNYRPCTSLSCPPTKQVISGYEVSQTVSVKIRNLEKVPEIFTGIGEIGVSDISGLSFIVDNEEDLKLEARKLAIQDAKEKAKKLAKDLNVSLDEITGFYEISEPYPFYADSFKGGIGGAGGVAVPSSVPEIPKGENQITINVSVTYRIK